MPGRPQQSLRGQYQSSHEVPDRPHAFLPVGGRHRQHPPKTAGNNSVAHPFGGWIKDSQLSPPIAQPPKRRHQHFLHRVPPRADFLRARKGHCLWSVLPHVCLVGWKRLVWILGLDFEQDEWGRECRGVWGLPQDIEDSRNPNLTDRFFSRVFS